jgi:glycosyltransferase involved in cell wall biosynthesis
MFDVTVVIPAHRRHSLLQGALSSALRQSFAPVQVVVVDGSRDKEVAQALSPHPLVRIIDAPGSTAAQARNIGLTASNTRFAAFLDSDDSWDSGFLRAMATATYQHRQAVLFAGAAQVALPGDRSQFVVPNEHQLSFQALLRRNRISTSGAMVLTSAALNVGGFMTGLTLPAGCEDWALWLRLAKNGLCVAVPNAICHRVETEAATSYNTSSEMADDMRKVLRDALEIPSNGDLPKRHLATIKHRQATAELAAGNRRGARRQMLEAIAGRPLDLHLWAWTALTFAPPIAASGARRAYNLVRASRRGTGAS